MGIFENNLNSLQKYRPQLYDRVKDYRPKNEYKIIISQHPKKYPNIIHLKKQIMGYNNIDPLNFVSKKLESSIKLPVFNLFLGFGLGYEVLTAVQHIRHNEAKFIVVDPEIEPFYHALKVIDMQMIIKNPNVFLLIGEKESNLFVDLHAIIMQQNLKLYVKAINIIENDMAIAVNPDYFKKVIQHLKDAVKEVLLHYGNDPWDSLIGIENTFLNIKEIIENPGIKDLKDTFKGKPGIVVATGPSLNKNIHLLKGLEDKAVICAVDASVRVMKQYNLKPHLVTSLERVLATAKLFEGLTKEDVNDVFLAACPVIRPETYANFPGERIIVYRNFATFKWLDIEKGTLDIGPSAANMAFKVLEFLGCNPIILIGQDLAFGDDDTTHAKGATYGEKEEQYHTKRQILEVEGNYKPKVKTTEVWYKFLKYYEKDIAQFKGTVINATEGGAKIPGTKVMAFKEVISEYLNTQFNVISIIRDNLKIPTKEEKEANYTKIMHKVEGALEYSDYVLHKFNEGYKYTRQFIDKIIVSHKNTGQYDINLAKELFDLSVKTLDVFGEKEFFEIFMHYVQSYFIRTMVEVYGLQGSNRPNEEINFNIILLLNDMYAVMIKLIEAMKSSLQKMKNILINN